MSTDTPTPASRRPVRSARGTDWVRVALYVLAVVVVNVASLKFFVRLDLTRSRAYSLSSATTAVLAGLKEPLTIKAFFTRNLPFPYNSVEQQTRDLFEEYALRANRHFSYSVHTVEPESETSAAQASDVRKMAQDYGIYPIQIQKVERDEVKLQSAYLGMVLIHGDMVETIPALTATDNLEYTVTSAIEKLSSTIGALLTVEGKVDVTLHLSSSLQRIGGNLGTTFRNLSRELESTVSGLNGKLYGKLAFSTVDPDTQPTAAVDAKKYSFMRLSLSTGQIAYASLVISYKEGFRRIDLLQQGIFGTQVKDPKTLGGAIEAATEALIGVNPQVGWVSDHGSGGESDELSSLLGPQEQPSYRNFRGILSGNYAIEDVALANDEIPEGVRTLLIAGPATRFTDWELFKIDQFLMKGNSLAILLDTHTEIVPQGGNQFQQPVYVPRETGIDKLLEHWGLRVDRSYVLDEKCYVARQQDRSGGIQEVSYYFFPRIGTEGLDQKLPIARNLPALFMLNASPVTKVEGTASQAAFHALVTSSVSSWEMKENINLLYPMFVQPPPAGDASRGARTLAYVVEGKLTSYFADKPVPEPPPPSEDAGGGASGAGGGGQTVSSAELGRAAEVIPETLRGRVIVVGTSQILVDTAIDAQGQQPNSVFALNIVDYLSGREGFAELRGKGSTVSLLREVKPEVRSFVKGFNIAGLPILVVLAGLGVWLGWMSRKKRIRAQFAPRASEAPGSPGVQK